MTAESPERIERELSAVTSFLCKHYPSVFSRIDESTLQVSDPMEAIIMASSCNSFFLKQADGDVTHYNIRLQRDFTAPWAIDYYRAYPKIFEGKKTVRFFPHWVPTKGYTGKGAERREKERVKDMLGALHDESKETLDNPGDVLYVPYLDYGAGRQFSETIYHYLAGMYCRSHGYLVFDEYAPSIMTETMRTPDLSAFATRRIQEGLSALQSRGIIVNGAFEQELQLYSIFKRKSTIRFENKLEFTNAPAVAIEVKRGESHHLLEKGRIEMMAYMTEAYGLYDAGYVAAPLIERDVPGSMTFLEDGTISVYGAERTNAQPSDFLLEKRRQQLVDVWKNMVMQLLKNLPLARIPYVCGGEIHSFSDLWEALDSVDIGVLASELTGNKDQAC